MDDIFEVVTNPLALAGVVVGGAIVGGIVVADIVLESPMAKGAKGMLKKIRNINYEIDHSLKWEDLLAEVDAIASTQSQDEDLSIDWDALTIECSLRQ